MKNKIYNKHLNQFVILNRGESYCDKCGGRGRIVNRQKNFEHKPIELQCSKCLGTGKLDWIEKAIGKGRR